MPRNVNPLTPDEITRIDELLAKGMSQKQVSREVGRAQSTISLHCKRTGQVPVHRTPIQAINRHIELSIESRIEHTAELAAKVLEIARKAKSGKEIRECSVAWGVLIDKVALLENRPTSISESRAPGKDQNFVLNLQEEFAKLDALAEREAIEESSGHSGEEYGAAPRREGDDG